jgi:hypothetical protein
VREVLLGSALVTSALLSVAVIVREVLEEEPGATATVVQFSGGREVGRWCSTELPDPLDSSLPKVRFTDATGATVVLTGTVQVVAGECSHTHLNAMED